ncbi:MAG: aspartate aminotransferase family protein [Chloroflexota bacterium]
MSIEETYIKESPRSRTFFEEACAVMPGGAKGAYYHSPHPLTMARAEGCYLYDVDERRLVDFANHHTTQILGHNHPVVSTAIQAQLARGIALGAPVGVETELATEMCERVASIEKIRFCNSGTEATLHAIRLARGFSGKPKIAKFEGGYHGSHDVVEISVAPPLDKAGPETAPHAVPTVGGLSPNAASEVVVLPYNDEASVEKLLRHHQNELACVIFDPRASILNRRPEFVQFVREITAKLDMLLIFDEIVGFRVGRGGMQEFYNITPDLSTYGKVIGGGFPVGAFGGRADIMDLFDNSKGPTGFSQSGSFSAHPITMTAGLATLKQLTPAAFEHINGLGERLRHGLIEVFARKQISAQVVGTGSMFGFHFTDEPMLTYRALARADKSWVQAIFLSLMNQGYFMAQGLSMGCVSLPMNSEHIDGFVAAVDIALDQVKR